MESVPADVAAPAPVPAEKRALDLRFLGVALCFLLSGFAALLYQTAWLRQFSIVFGTSELAIATVLASYMGGLAAGAAFAGRFLVRVRRPVLVYGLLELGIALGALAVPFELDLARSLFAQLLGGKAELPDAGSTGQLLFFLGISFLVLLPPTAMMGATLPMLTRHAVRREREIASRVGGLYAINTAGAVVGTLVAAFLLLPHFGLRGTVLLGAGVNGAVFLLAALLSWGEPVPVAVPVDGARAGDDSGSRYARFARWMLPMMAVSGAASFVYEVLWSRLLSHLLGASVYAFATMLASFLVGITLGSAVASAIARTRRAAWIGFMVAQIGVALASVAIYFGLDRLAGAAQARGMGENASLWTNVSLAALVLLPATSFIGATFPFALRAVARSEADAGSAAARVYAWNTVGAIVGAVLAGFVLLPQLGFAGTLEAAALVGLLLALAAALVLGRRVVTGLAATAILAFLLAVHPGSPEALLRMSPMVGVPGEGKIVFEAVGRSATVLMLERDGYFDLRSNGLPEAFSLPRGAPPVGSLGGQPWLTFLPALARPEMESLLLIGFGGGTVLAGVPPGVKVVDVVEIEPEVIAANRSIAELRAEDPLRDPRLRIVINDARGALAMSDVRYDAIVSQPSHPWTAGASHLYTREFMEVAREHLTPGGVFLQWLQSAFVDEELFASVGATLLDTFADVRLYRPNSSMLLFLASDEPLDLERRIAADPDRFGDAREHFARLGITSLSDVAAHWALDRSGLSAICAGAPINTDDRNTLAMRSSRALRAPLGPEGVNALVLPHDPLADPESALWNELRPHLDVPRMAVRLFVTGHVQKAERIANGSPSFVEKALAFSQIKALVGQHEEARALVEQAYQADARNRNATFAYIRQWLPAMAEGSAPALIQRRIATLKNPESAVIRGWAHALRGEWSEVVPLDEGLAQAEPTDACYFDAVRLRTLARAAGAFPGPLAERGREALDIIDRAVVTQPLPECLLARLAAAIAAEDPAAELETAAELTIFLGLRKATTPPYLRQDVARELARFLERLKRRPEAFTAVRSTRVDEVRERVAAALRAGPGCCRG